MKRSSTIIVIALAAGIAGGALYWLLSPRATLPASPLAAVPAEATFAARIHLDRVLASQAYQRLVLARGGARGIAEIREVCGFDPLARVRELTVFGRASPTDGAPSVALLARGDLSRSELLDCVEAFGGERTKLEREDVAGVTTLRSQRGHSRAAFIGPDGVLAGDAESVRAAIHAIVGRVPSMAEDATLTALARELGEGSDLALVGSIPPALEAALARWADGASVAAIEKARALGLTLTTSADSLALGAVLVTDEPAHAAELVSAASALRERLLAVPELGRTPLASVLRGAQLEARGARAIFTAALKLDTIEALLELAPALRVSRNVHRAPRGEADGGRSGKAPVLDEDAGT